MTEWCDDCGGAVRQSTVLEGRWVHVDTDLWAVKAHPARRREPPTPIEPHNQESPDELPAV